MRTVFEAIVQEADNVLMVDLIRKLCKEFPEENVRYAVWELIDDRRVTLTGDRKLRVDTPVNYVVK